MGILTVQGGASAAMEPGEVTTEETIVESDSDKKQVDIIRTAEVEYGITIGQGIPDYKDYDFGVYLNSDKQLKEGVDGKGKLATYWGGDQPKKGLKTDLGKDVYNGLSDAQQAMMRMQHVNIGWDPRVTMLISSGVIPASKRKEYLDDYKKTTALYNKTDKDGKQVNKTKFSKIDDQKMFDQWVDLYANTEPNEKSMQRQYKKRVEDMAKAYNLTLTPEQLDKFKIK